jgi:ribosomal protein S10
MSNRIADIVQAIIVALLLGLGGATLALKDTVTTLTANYAAIDRTLTEVKTKLDVQADTKVTKADFDTYKAQIYERMRAIEESQKATAQAIADLTRVQTELTRDVAEINLRGRK